MTLGKIATQTTTSESGECELTTFAFSCKRFLVHRKPTKKPRGTAHRVFDAALCLFRDAADSHCICMLALKQFGKDKYVCSFHYTSDILRVLDVADW